jgi:hypothetical protein
LTFFLLKVKNNYLLRGKLIKYIFLQIHKQEEIKTMQKKKEKKQEKKKYTKMVLTKHNKLRDITALQVTVGDLGCTKFLF